MYTAKFLHKTKLARVGADVVHATAPRTPVVSDFEAMYMFDNNTVIDYNGVYNGTVGGSSSEPGEATIDRGDFPYNARRVYTAIGGSGDNSIIGGVPNINLLNGFSIFGWVYRIPYAGSSVSEYVLYSQGNTTTTPQSPILSKFVSFGIERLADESTIIFLKWNDSDSVLNIQTKSATIPVITEEQWVNVGVTISDTEITFYYNGVKVGTETYTFTIPSGISTNAYIGGINAQGIQTNRTINIDDIRIYTNVVTERSATGIYTDESITYVQRENGLGNFDAEFDIYDLSIDENSLSDNDYFSHSPQQCSFNIPIETSSEWILNNLIGDTSEYTNYFMFIYNESDKLIFSGTCLTPNYNENELSYAIDGISFFSHYADLLPEFEVPILREQECSILNERQIYDYVLEQNIRVFDIEFTDTEVSSPLKVGDKGLFYYKDTDTTPDKYYFIVCEVYSLGEGITFRSPLSNAFPANYTDFTVMGLFYEEEVGYFLTKDNNLLEVSTGLDTGETTRPQYDYPAKYEDWWEYLNRYIIWRLNGTLESTIGNDAKLGWGYKFEELNSPFTFAWDNDSLFTMPKTITDLSDTPVRTAFYYYDLDGGITFTRKIQGKYDNQFFNSTVRFELEDLSLPFNKPDDGQPSDISMFTMKVLTNDDQIIGDDKSGNINWTNYTGTLKSQDYQVSNSFYVEETVIEDVDWYDYTPPSGDAVFKVKISRQNGLNCITVIGTTSEQWAETDIDPGSQYSSTIKDKIKESLFNIANSYLSYRSGTFRDNGQGLRYLRSWLNTQYTFALKDTWTKTYNTDTYPQPTENDGFGTFKIYADLPTSLTYENRWGLFFNGANANISNGTIISDQQRYDGLKALKLLQTMINGGLVSDNSNNTPQTVMRTRNLLQEGYEGVFPSVDLYNITNNLQTYSNDSITDVLSEIDTTVAGNGEAINLKQIEDKLLSFYSDVSREIKRSIQAVYYDGELNFGDYFKINNNLGGNRLYLLYSIKDLDGYQEIKAWEVTEEVV